MRLLVLGAGGIGGYFGGRLAAANADVTFLVRAARCAALELDGLQIKSDLGDVSLPVRLTQVVTPTDKFDLVLLSCKAYDLQSALEALHPLAGRTVVLPLLNGLAHYPRLDDLFGGTRVLGGLAHIMVALSAGGAIVHRGNFHQLTYGARHSEQQEVCERLAAVLAAAQFEARQSANILQDSWEKFSFITAAASLTCLMRSAVGPLMATAGGSILAHALLDECDQIAASEGFAPRAKARDAALRTLTQPGSPFKASMLRDIEAGRMVEADHLQGDMLKRGQRHGVATPWLNAAYAHLQCYMLNRSANDERAQA